MIARPTIFLVDDDEALRRATARLLDAHGFAVRAFASAEEFLTSFDAQAPGCLLLDLRMPGKSGLELQQTLRERHSLLPVIFLTGHGDVSTSVFAMKEGAIDFLEKPVAEHVLVAALHNAFERDAALRREGLERRRLEECYASLTPREREVFAEMIAGRRNKQAAHALGIAERTIRLHRARVLEKMGARTLADLGRMAERLGLHKRSSGSGDGAHPPNS